jgi:hypothetical protein
MNNGSLCTLGIGAMAEYRTIVDDIKKQVEQLNANDEAL